MDSGDWEALLTDVQDTSYTYPSDYAHSYTFRVTATDNVGNAGQSQADAIAPNAVTKYYYSGGQRVAMRKPDGAVNWLHGDHLGSTSLATDGAGNQVSRQLYYPFGEVRWVTGTLPTDFGYTGQRLDDTGLMFYHARYYAPQVGRFVSADTIVPNPATPQNFNRYSYVVNNPLRYTDPSGNWYYDPGCRCLVKTKDPTHENAIDPVSTEHHSGSRYLNYDETWQSSPIQPIMPQDGGAAYCAATYCAPAEPLIEGTLTVIAIFVEPVDWALTFKSWAEGDFHILDLVGLLPGLTSQVDEVGDVLRGSEKVDDMLGFARRVDPNKPAGEILSGTLRRKFLSEHLDKSLEEIKHLLKTATEKEKRTLQQAKKILEQSKRLIEKAKERRR